MREASELVTLCQRACEHMPWIFVSPPCKQVQRPVIRVYLVWLPEELLILNQLIFARDTFGRVLSPATADCCCGHDSVSSIVLNCSTRSGTCGQELLRLGEQPDADDCVGDDVPQLSEGFKTPYVSLSLKLLAPFAWQGLNLAQRPNGP
eukprot:4282967-Amphidinium_carterae.1